MDPGLKLVAAVISSMVTAVGGVSVLAHTRHAKTTTYVNENIVDLSKLDANADGIVDVTEARVAVDKDRDKKLSMSEVADTLEMVKKLDSYLYRDIITARESILKALTEMAQEQKE